MRIAIVSGKSEGPTKLNAFDNALSKAGIGDINIIKVSSMLGPNTEIVELSELKPGSMIKCVLSNCESDKKGDIIVASVGVGIGDKLGCVVENRGINRDIEDVRKENKEMVEYMMEIRGEKINNLILEDVSHVVENIGSVVSSVVYLDEEAV